MRTKLSTQRISPVDSAVGVSMYALSGPLVSSTGNRARKQARALSALALLAGLVLTFSPVGFSDQGARADYMKQPVQEFMQPDDPVYDMPRDTDYNIDQQPQYAPPDTEDVIDANDAEVTTPIAAFFFWLVMGGIAVAGLAYALLSTGFARAR
jgi:hypothetical protein